MTDEWIVQVFPDPRILPGILCDRAFPVPVTVPVFPAGTGGYRFP